MFIKHVNLMTLSRKFAPDSGRGNFNPIKLFFFWFLEEREGCIDIWYFILSLFDIICLISFTKSFYTFGWSKVENWHPNNTCFWSNLLIIVFKWLFSQMLFTCLVSLIRLIIRYKIFLHYHLFPFYFILYQYIKQQFLKSYNLT